MTDPRSNVFDMWPARVEPRIIENAVFADDSECVEDMLGNPLPGVWDAVVEFISDPRFFVGAFVGLAFVCVAAFVVAF